MIVQKEEEKTPQYAHEQDDETELRQSNSEENMQKQKVMTQEEHMEELTTDRGLDETPAMRSELNQYDTHAQATPFKASETPRDTETTQREEQQEA